MRSDEVMALFVLYLGFALIGGFIAGAIASKKGRSYFGFFILTLFSTPLIGIIVALLVGENKSKLDNRRISYGISRKCPFCAEVIKSEAIICRYCGKEVGVQIREGKIEENGISKKMIVGGLIGFIGFLFFGFLIGRLLLWLRSWW